MKADEKECPRCAEIIKARAKVCRFCGYVFAPLPDTPTPTPSSSAPAPGSSTPAPPAPVEIKAGDVLDLLSALVDKSLVVYEQDQNGQGRYRLLETVRQYSRERLEAGEEATVLRIRHRDWYLALSEESEPKLAGPETGIWLERLESEHDNLRSALSWSLEVETGKREEGRGKRGEEEPEYSDQGQSEIQNPKSEIAEAGLRLCGALQWFWQIRGHLEEGRAWCAAALEAEEASGRTVARAKALNGAGVLAWSQGDYASARTYLEASLSIQQEIGDKKGIASSFSNLGNVACDLGDYAGARIYLEESLSIFQEIGDKRGIARSLFGLGDVAINQGDYTGARTYHEASLSIQQEIGDKKGIASSFSNLGNVAWLQGDYTSARTYLEESLSIQQEIGDKQGVAISLNFLGQVAKFQGDFASARTYLEESLSIFQAIGDKQGVATSLGNLGTVAGEQGDYTGARTYHEASLAIQRESGHKQGFAWSLFGLGDVAFSEGDYAGAQTYFEQSLPCFREIGEKRGIVITLDGFAALAATKALAATAPADTAETARKAGSEQIGCHLRRAARLWGAVEALREALGTPLSPREWKKQEPEIAAAQEKLGEADWAMAWAEGRALTLEQAIDYALSNA